MAYADLATIQDTDPGDILTAAWCDQVRDNEEFLIDPPACSVFDSAGTAVPDGTLTVLDADSENFDNDSMHSTASNDSRVTVQTAGRYEFHVRVNFQADVTPGTRRVIQFLVNGTTGVSVLSVPALGGANSQTLSAFMTRDMAAADYVETRVLHDAGNSLTVTLVEFYAKFETR